MTRALITGITGQDGSYLAEFLLRKGYEVHGIVRRASTEKFDRINHIIDRLVLHQADLLDQLSLIRVLEQAEPDDIYNLAAQSFVPTSWEQPLLTGEFTALGVTRVLEAIRAVNRRIRFYQASSSEMFGKVRESPQNELTPFYPRSPYGVAKVYGHFITVNYRESYDIFAVSGILFNHETVSASTPVIYKREDGFVDIAPIAEVVREQAGVPVDESRRTYQAGPPRRPLEVWDRDGWTRVTYASAYPHDRDGENKRPRLINARQACYMGTSSHVAILADGRERTFGEIEPGDRVALIPHPAGGSVYAGVTKDRALLLGILAGDGWISGDGRSVSVTSSSEAMRGLVRDLWSRLGGSSCYFYPTRSGFNASKVVGKLDLNGQPAWLAEFELYTKERTPFGHRTKRVPWQILNSPPEIMREFLRGYNLSDGLKSNPCTYEFRNFKTNSATLAAGLVYLIGKTTGQQINLTVDESRAWGSRTFYYSINLLSDSSRGETARRQKPRRVRELLAVGMSQRAITRQTGISRTYVCQIARGCQPPTRHHLVRPGDEVKKVIEVDDYDGWFYDLETESGTFHGGIGLGHVHNSPRRGLEFVTRKVTHGVAAIALGKAKELRLGNLEAQRDWGFAGDYVEAMWMMLQRPAASDYVIGTGIMHSVEDVARVAFEHVGLDWRKYVVQDPALLRPAEVEQLCADSRRAERELGWKPRVSFDRLIQMMVEADLALLEGGESASRYLELSAAEGFRQGG